MAINIEMPKLSDTMTEGTLISWKVSVGDEVEIGDVIAEIETDKATMEMEAFDEGVISQILVEAGAKAPVGAALAILSEDGEQDSTAPAPVATEAAADTPATKTEAPAKTELSSAPVTLVSSNGSRIAVSPLARKIAAKKGIDVSTLKGSGPGGRIVAADVENAQATPVATSTTSAPAATAPAAPAQGIKPSFGDEDTVIPLTGMRKIIADRLLTSKQTIPHFYLHVEADTASLMALRKQVNAQAEETHGNKYSVNDFVIKALTNACVAHPAVNAAFNGDSIVEFKNVGISVAISVEDGLVTPVIKQAQTKSMLQISQEVKAMAKRARDKKLLPNEFDNGTITISNLGAWGIDSFDAIVNPPQAAILSVGGISQKPVVVNGEIVVGQRMNIGLSCDHRVVDGAVAANFLNEVKRLIENPTLMLV